MLCVESSYFSIRMDPFRKRTEVIEIEPVSSEARDDLSSTRSNLRTGDW